MSNKCLISEVPHLSSLQKGGHILTSIFMYVSVLCRIVKNVYPQMYEYESLVTRSAHMDTDTKLNITSYFFLTKKIRSRSAKKWRIQTFFLGYPWIRIRIRISGISLICMYIDISSAICIILFYVTRLYPKLLLRS